MAKKKLGPTPSTPGLLCLADVGLAHCLLVQSSCFPQLEIGADQGKPGGDKERQAATQDAAGQSQAALRLLHLRKNGERKKRVIGRSE